MNETEELRELDKWIAVHVFGWVVETRKMYAGEKNVSGFGLNTHLSAGDSERHFCPKSTFPYERYTTNDADALNVLDRCAKKCPVAIWFDLETWLIADNGKDDGEDNETSAETLPLAISKFAKLLYSEKG